MTKNLLGAHIALPTTLPVTLDQTGECDLQVLLMSASGFGRQAQLTLGDAVAAEASAMLEQVRFSAAAGGTHMLASATGTPTMVVGVSSFKLGAAALRELGQKISAEATARGFAKVNVVMEKFSLCHGKAMQAMAYGLKLGAGHFSLRSTAKDTALESVNLKLPANLRKCNSERLLNKADAEAMGVLLMQQLVLLPPNILGTAELAQVAILIAELCPAVKVEITGQDKLAEMGFGAMTAVGRASPQDSLLITLRYEGDASKPLQALVGKGLVYDSGGMSLKSNPKNMKGDMGGSALVLGTVLAAAVSNAPVNMVAVIGAVENAIGSDCYRPDDVLTAYNGKTIEIGNTDAEGRLVLADCLAHTEATYKPANIFSFATLTGAAVAATGRRAPIFSKDRSLAKAVEDAADKAGEMVLYFPMDDYLWPLLNSPIADLSNIGRGGPGHTTAAIFLNHFVENVPFCHVDIAGACDVLTLSGPDKVFG